MYFNIYKNIRQPLHYTKCSFLNTLSKFVAISTTLLFSFKGLTTSIYLFKVSDKSITILLEKNRG